MDTELSPAIGSTFLDSTFMNNSSNMNTFDHSSKQVKQNSWRQLFVNDLFSCLPRQMAHAESGEFLPVSDSGDSAFFLVFSTLSNSFDELLRNDRRVFVLDAITALTQTKETFFNKPLGKLVTFSERACRFSQAAYVTDGRVTSTGKLFNLQCSNNSQVINKRILLRKGNVFSLCIQLHKLVGSLTGQKEART